jgi:Zn-dependent protease with chaperone function
MERWWPSGRLPRVTVGLLQLLTCSFLVATTTAFLALAVTLIDALARIDPAVDACADQLPINDESAVGPLIGDFGLAVAIALALRICYCVVATFGVAWLRRRSHTAMLRVCARPDNRLGVMVLEHELPACYCMPGRPGRPGTIVVTSGTLGRLTERQLGAVLSHERAHLRGRHHLLVAFAHSVRRVTPGVRLLAYAERETRRLVELIADDTAARSHGALTVAAALAAIGAGHVPGAALGIGPGDGPPTVARVSRLIDPRRRLGRNAVALSVTAVAVTILLPVALAALSAYLLLGHCPRSTDDETPGSAPAAVRVVTEAYHYQA